MTRFMSAPAGAVRQAFHLDRTRLAAVPGVRATLGLALPLAIGIAVGHVLWGVAAAIGAISGGFASLQGTYRSRAWIVVAATAGMALSAFVGSSAGHLLGAGIALTAVWGFAAGMLVAFGPAAGIVGLQSVVNRPGFDGDWIVTNSPGLGDVVTVA